LLPIVTNELQIYKPQFKVRGVVGDYDIAGMITHESVILTDDIRDIEDVVWVLRTRSLADELNEMNANMKIYTTSDYNRIEKELFGDVEPK